VRGLHAEVPLALQPLAPGADLTHLEHMLTKLDISPRAQLASAVTRHRRAGQA
jgi:hypothetical protein